jgi:hypothetical protein
VTDEEVNLEKAQAELDAAIDKFMVTSGFADAGVLTAYMLVCHQTKWDEDGDAVDTYPLIYKGGLQSRHINIGLLEVARDLYRSSLLREPRT